MAKRGMQDMAEERSEDCWCNVTWNLASALGRGMSAVRRGSAGQGDAGIYMVRCARGMLVVQHSAIKAGSTMQAPRGYVDVRVASLGVE